MAKKKIDSPFQALEQEAYQAFREWPIWLVLRRRELAAHLERAGADVRSADAARSRASTLPVKRA